MVKPALASNFKTPAGATRDDLRRTFEQTGNVLDYAADHIEDVDNPHATTATQVGLGNVTNDAQLKRAANDFASFANKAAPVAGDRVLLEDSAAAGVKTYATLAQLGIISAGAQPLYVPPSSPHVDDLEFDDTSVPAGWELYNVTDASVVTPTNTKPDPYTSGGTTSYWAFHTDARRSFMQLQLPETSKDYLYTKQVTVGTNRFIWTRMGGPLHTSWNAGNPKWGVGFFSSVSSHASLADCVLLYLESNTTGGVGYQLISAKLVAGVYTAIAASAVSSTDGTTRRTGTLGYEYLGIGKRGTQYYFYAANDAGPVLNLLETGHAATLDRIGLYFNGGGTTVTTPKNPVFRADFFRNLPDGYPF